MPKSYVSRGTSGQNVLRRLAQPLIAVSNGRVEVARGGAFSVTDQHHRAECASSHSRARDGGNAIFLKETH